MYGMTHKSALPDVALYELYDRLKDAGDSTKRFTMARLKTATTAFGTMRAARTSIYGP